MSESNSIERYIRVATTFYEELHDWSKAIEYFQKAIEEAPDDYRGWFGILRIFTNDFSLTSGQYSSQPWWEYGLKYLGEDIKSFSDKHGYLNQGFWFELVAIGDRMVVIAKVSQANNVVETWQNYHRETLISLKALQEKFLAVQERMSVQRQAYYKMRQEIEKVNDELISLENDAPRGFRSVLPYFAPTSFLRIAFNIWLTFAMVAVVWHIQKYFDPTDYDFYYRYNDLTRVFWFIGILSTIVLIKLARNKNYRERLNQLSIDLGKMEEETQVFYANVYKPLLDEYNEIRQFC